MAAGTIQKESFPYRRQLSASDNLNDLVNVRGVFKVGTQPENCPGAWGTLYNEVIDSGTQMFVNAAGLYVRTRSGSPTTWKDWIRAGFSGFGGVTWSSSIDDFDSTYTNNNLKIVVGVINNQAYISFDISWIRLQFRTQSSGAPQTRTIYGNTTGTWRTIA